MRGEVETVKVARWKRVWCNYYEAGYPRTRNERPTTPSLMRVRARQDFELAWQGRLLYTMLLRHTKTGY
jgi:hypothetical protein